MAYRRVGDQPSMRPDHPIKASSTSRAATILSIVFLFAVIVLCGFLTSRQMDAAHGAPGVAQTGIYACCLAAVAGVIGFISAWGMRVHSHRRVALLAYAFGTVLLLVEIYNLARPQ